ncbi:baseplate J/gp47 family protein [Thalassolituus sp. UBA2009]|uniref:baseplate J/gp47 family protein n=1 Tax=Thalassolituus sp. UBA2009 TaxID=1947658 RepID=UPI00257D60B2|nr:baseplate J/gp47 family protein [Thalassolituus sp. UBA2009]
MADIERASLDSTQQYFYDQAKNAGLPVTKADIETEFQDKADAAGLKFNNDSKFSPFWKFLRSVAVSPFQQLIAFVITGVMPNLFLKTASKSYLDMIGWSRDIERKKRQALTGFIQFNRDSTGSSLSVKAGTLIKTAAINGKVYRVVTTEEGIFTGADSSINIPVKAENPGAEYNLAAGYFSSLVTPITGITSVTNTENWIATPGTDDEEDDDYRERIRARFPSVSDWHVTAVYKSIIAEQIGIEYSKIYIEYNTAPRGAGSADALVVFDDGVSSSDYLNKVNAYITDQGYHGLGDDLRVKAFPETQHNIVAALYAMTGTSAADMAAAADKAEQIIRCAFRQNSAYDIKKTWYYKRFSMSNLASEIMDRIPVLTSVEFNTGDIVSEANIPRLQTLTVSITEDAA